MISIISQWKVTVQRDFSNYLNTTESPLVEFVISDNFYSNIFQILSKMDFGEVSTITIKKYTDLVTSSASNAIIAKQK